MEKVLQFLKDCGTFYLATVDNDQARVRPFGAVCGYNGKLYITTNNQKPVYRQMKADPKVEISGMVGGSWLRLAANAVEDPSWEARVAMLEANPGLSGMYSADDGLMVVFSLENAEAQFCSFTSAPEIVRF